MIAASEGMLGIMGLRQTTNSAGMFKDFLVAVPRYCTKQQPVRGHFQTHRYNAVKPSSQMLKNDLK